MAKGSKSGLRRRSLLTRVITGIGVVMAIPIVLVIAYRFVPPVSTLMLFQRVTGKGVERIWVGLDVIAPALVQSVIMSEDGRFCSHWGIDWKELNRVISEEDGPSRGASTIAMQTVKNLFLWPSRSYLRKAVEIPLALFADLVWGKRREMEIYLNVAEFGPGIFGAEAAARRHFGRSARTLTTAQAALLAAALPDPGERNPARPSAALRARAAAIAEQAAASGAYVDCLYP